MSASRIPPAWPRSRPYFPARCSAATGPTPPADNIVFGGINGYANNIIDATEDLTDKEKSKEMRIKRQVVNREWLKEFFFSMAHISPNYDDKLRR